MTRTAPDNTPRNPDYGSGIYRRRIRLQGEEGRVVAELEDTNHGFRSIVSHDGYHITSIQGEALRYPMTTCPGALPLLQALVGTAIDADISSINQSTNPKSHCTHLFDLTVSAIQHCKAGQATRVIDIVIPDEQDNHNTAEIFYDGRLVLSWTVSNWALQDKALQGKYLASGFGKWANEIYTGEQLEAAFLLQKGYMVSYGRRFDMNKLQGTPAGDSGSMLGACHSYTPGIVEEAVRTVGNTRDFTDCEEKLLRFENPLH
ncbi:DUF2889 domain-containing protein [Pseudomaricurvus sp. HS19]|uniref:DUF2889 domain-containing protein n=1 Tax=Pseudomaricurvus sp. HS19 TaxID=2692626 RepID=UPI00136B3AC1|nr:DUF2889 domain-containing protein [Pseudomaricurvus sp. HS19]MYM63456.1 DUF2889 domain-containing protein [Pseudomaricurvus sp. HS19]